MIPEPDQATPRHVARCRRFTVVIRRERLQIQFQEEGTALDVMIGRGEASWDEPDDTAHRAVSIGPRSLPWRIRAAGSASAAPTRAVFGGVNRHY